MSAERNTLRALASVALQAGEYAGRDLGQHGAEKLGEIADRIRVAKWRLGIDDPFNGPQMVDAERVRRELDRLAERLLDLGHEIFPATIDDRRERARLREIARRARDADPMGQGGGDGR